MKKFLFALMASATFLCAVPHEITPVIGGVHPFGSDKLDSHTTYGLRLGLGINTAVVDQIEFGYDYSKDVKYSNSKGISDFHRVYLNAIKEFSISNKAKLYGIVGLGHEDLCCKSYGYDVGAFGQYGIGLKYYVDDYFSIRGEVRHGIKFDSGDNNLFYSIGFSIPIGGAEKASVAVEPAVQTIQVVEEKKITEIEDDTEDDIVIIDEDDENITEDDIIIIDEDEDIALTEDEQVYAAAAEESKILKGVTKVMSLSINGFNGAVVRKKHFNFNFDSTQVLKNDEETAARIAKDLSGFQDIRIRNEGHTDSIGTSFYNLKLSQKRSETVKDKLVEYGVSKNQIETVGYGSSKPIRENNTPDGRAENRRVEVVFIAPVYYFESNSAKLTQEGEETLKAIAKKLEGYEKTIIRVEGHTDSTGSKLHNLKLSQKRADTVKDKLVEYGVSSNNIEAKGFGSAHPIKPNNTKDGRATNRRVDIIFVDNGN
ncbi:MAG: OmpA family protein [Campylobacteraceae bacterium]|jgi:OOP family OmpA-OmpF porin|nr:OmpA family protein [Campylobacteraceae bacterium]